jgi:hypothetical protein
MRELQWINGFGGCCGLVLFELFIASVSAEEASKG